jgi:hypothetical protein
MLSSSLNRLDPTCQSLRGPPYAGLSACRILCLALLDEAQPSAQDLARVLVTTGPNQLVDEFFLMIRQYAISRWLGPGSSNIGSFGVYGI